MVSTYHLGQEVPNRNLQHQTQPIYNKSQISLDTTDGQSPALKQVCHFRTEGKQFKSKEAELDCFLIESKMKEGLESNKTGVNKNLLEY